MPSIGILKIKLFMSSPHIIEETNLSNAWYKTLAKIDRSPGTEISPLIITITEFRESVEMKNLLDRDLIENGLDCIDTVSETIFPNSLYLFCDNKRDRLYKEYNKNLPRIKKIDPRNSRGTYFERLIAYGEDKPINQLEIIISSLQNSKVKRRSKLQASIFDPFRDHTNKMFQGFPCLQHITFYKSETGGLILNSFYAIQYLYQRAYGNWLGLINLGKFVANELHLDFERFNCFVGVESLDHLTKDKAKKLLKKIDAIVDFKLEENEKG